jgi:hypothetical protein
MPSLVTKETRIARVRCYRVSIRGKSKERVAGLISMLVLRLLLVGLDLTGCCLLRKLFCIEVT